jgi:hypothetical protein
MLILYPIYVKIFRNAVPDVTEFAKCLGVIIGMRILFFIYSILILREEHSLRVLENKVLKKILGRKREEVTGEWRRLHMRSLIACTLYQVLFG